MVPCRQLHTTAAIEAAAQETSTASHSTRAMGFSVNVSQLAEEDEAVVDLLAGKRLQPLGAKAFARERAHHAAVKHGAAIGGRCEFGLRGQVAEESAGKAVARTGWIHHHFQWKPRRPELRDFTLWSGAVK